MAKTKKFDDKNLKEMIALYKKGASIEDLKAKYHCYGNPLVRRLKEAGCYRKPGTVAKTKAKPARFRAGKTVTATKKARKAQVPTPAPESPVSVVATREAVYARKAPCQPWQPAKPYTP